MRSPTAFMIVCTLVSLAPSVRGDDQTARSQPLSASSQEATQQSQASKEDSPKVTEDSKEVAQSREAADAVITKTNGFREAEGLKPLRPNAELTQTASQFAAFMARESKYGHGADGRTPAERAEAAGYDYCVVRENIAYRVDPSEPDAAHLAEVFFTGWKESQEHRENMLAKHVTETGVAIASVDGKTFFAVQLFGRPESDKFQVQIHNQTESQQTVRFVTPWAKDEIAVPAGATLMISRCVPTQVSLEKSGPQRTVEGEVKLAIQLDPEGKPEIVGD